MEDAHVYIYNFADVPDSGYFAIFDGHAGSEAAHWCSKHLHSILENIMRRSDGASKHSNPSSTTSSKSSDSKKKHLWKRETPTIQAIGSVSPSVAAVAAAAVKAAAKAATAGHSTTADTSTVTDFVAPADSASPNAPDLANTTSSSTVAQESKPLAAVLNTVDYPSERQSPLTDFPPNSVVPMALNSSFLEADAKMAKDVSLSCGCTAAVAVIRWESPPVTMSAPVAQPSSIPSSPITEGVPVTTTRAKTPPPPADSLPDLEPNQSLEPPSSSEPIPSSSAANSSESRKRSVSSVPSVQSQSSFTHSVIGKNRSRVLYTANVGDARLVLCRGGKALRLSYDHKGSDPIEAARITNSGGIMYGNRVNGMLAVTRSLGDAYMKSLVTGNPYTTRTVIGTADEFLIVACDGIWDVCTDQEAVDLVRNIMDPKKASQTLVKYAIDNFSSDNITCMVIRLDPSVCAM